MRDPAAEDQQSRASSPVAADGLLLEQINFLTGWLEQEMFCFNFSLKLARDASHQNRVPSLGIYK